MTVQTVNNVNPTIEWDDSIVFVFSFNDANNNRVFCGIYHQVTALQLTTGQQAQITPLLQAISQNSFQGSSDPQTWIEDVKTSARNPGTPANPGTTLTIVYDDGLSVTYTTLTNQSFTLQFLHSLAG
jgi:hypothetical protein